MIEFQSFQLSKKIPFKNKERNAIFEWHGKHFHTKHTRPAITSSSFGSRMNGKNLMY